MAEAMPLRKIRNEKRVSALLRKKRRGDTSRDVTRGAPLLLTNIGQLLTLSAGTPGPRRRPALSELSVIEDAAVLCGAGQIISVGRARDALRNPWIRRNRK